MSLCANCGHTEDDHERESWFDEEGVEGMSCEAEGCTCQGWTWDWAKMVDGSVMFEGARSSVEE